MASASTDKKIHAKRQSDTHSSQFLITLNSNSTDEKWAPILTDALEQWYNNIESYLVAADPELVDSIDEPTAACEKGPITGMWHCHMFIKISHRTWVQIDLEKTRNFFKDMCDRNVYCNVKHVKDYGVSISNYLKKQSQ